MSKSQRTKGNRLEREIVTLHKSMGIHAERYPLSGASHFRGSGHDIDIYRRGRDAPYVCEIKGRGNGEGFKTLERWLGEYDALFLRRDRAEPMVVLPWRVWRELIGGKDAETSKTDGSRPSKPQSGTSPEA